MKVRFEDNYKRYYTLEEFDNAKAVVSAEKEDEETAKGWAEYAINEALRNTEHTLYRVISADAWTAKNNRLSWDQFCEGSGLFDVWVEALAETYGNAYVKVGAYLTDIWQTGATPYKHHEYIVYYKKV